MYKIPISILVVIYNEKNQVLLLQRYDNHDFWQSVTGSLNSLNEQLHLAAQREVFEETGIIINSHINIDINNFKSDKLSFHTLCNLNYSVNYNIYPQFRYKYPPFTSTNQEHWFALKVEAQKYEYIILSDYEHIAFNWTDSKMAKQKCFSPSNAIAIDKII